MIKLYDFKSSPNCQRVKIVLAEKNLPYEIVPIDLRKQEQKTPGYLRLNPYGKVPVLTDDGTVLYESCIINEYLNDCEQLRGGELLSVPPLSDLETIVIDGARYEAFTTSGGVGTMCETFAGRVNRLDYKTIRYPGHCQLMRFMLRELGLGGRREEAVRLLADAYPPVRDDLVIVYAAADGTSRGRRAREEFVRVYRPRIVAGGARTAIAWTTAAGAVGMVELLAEGSLPSSGFVCQEDVSLDAFLTTSAGEMLAREPPAEVRDDISLLPVA